MDTLSLGRNIHKARRDRGLSSDRLSEMCNVTPAYLRAIEAGSKTPSLPLFVTICDQLGVSPSLLLAGVISASASTDIEELSELCKLATPSQMSLISRMIRTATESCDVL